MIQVTRDQIEAMTLATRIAVVNAGRIEAGEGSSGSGQTVGCAWVAT